MALIPKATALGNNDEATEYSIQDITGVYQAATGIVFTVDAPTNVFTSAGHGLTTGEIITVSSDTTLPSPLLVNTSYSVIIIDSNTFKLAQIETPTIEIDIADAGTGVHSFISGVNLGGFGSPNPERSTIALVLLTLLKATDGDVELTVQSYNPTTVGTFTVDSEDGVVENYMFALPLYTGGESDGDIVWDPTTAAAWKIDSSDPSGHVVLSLVSLLSEDSLVEDVDYAFIPDLIVGKSTIILNTFEAQYSDTLEAFLKNKCSKEELDEIKNCVDYVRVLISSAINNFCMELYTLAQSDIEKIIALNEDKQ